MNREVRKIAVDCDDVIADMTDGIRLFINETKGYTHGPEEYLFEGEYDGYYERLWGETSAELFKQFAESGRFAALSPVPGSLETLQALKDDHSLVMLTARSHFNVEITQEWLDTHAPNLFDEVTYTHRWMTTGGEVMTKADICKELGARCLIDDNYDHCRLMAEIGGQALLFGDYGWNRKQTLQPNMVRVNDWEGVRGVLLGE